jgi:hypothetical protein
MIDILKVFRYVPSLYFHGREWKGNSILLLVGKE